MASRPLFELFVKISEKGLDDLDKKLAAKEKQLQDAEERWDDFADKKFPKQIKGINKELDKVSKTFEKITKSQEEWVKNTTKGGKEQKKTLDGLLGQFQKIQQAVDKINKSGINLSGTMKGGDELSKQLDTLQKQVDNLRKNPDITIRTKVEGADEVIQKLQQIGEITAELRDQEVVIKVRSEGDQDVLNALQGIQDKKREIGDTPLEITADTSQLEQANADLERTRTQLQGVQGEADNTRGSFQSLGSDADVAGSSLTKVGDAGESSGKRLSVSFSDSDRNARILGRGIGGDDKDSISSSIRKMDADATAAQALPSFLGDVFAQLSQFKVIAAGIAASTIPVLIAGVGGAVGAIAALAAGAGALATSLGVGLAGAAATAGTALGLATVSMRLTASVATGAVSAVLGLGKGFGDLAKPVAAAKKEVQTFMDLVAAMPPGTNAAAQAQTRLGLATEYATELQQMQISWWAMYGEEANKLAESLNRVRLGILQSASDAAGQLIPTITRFSEVVNSLQPVITRSFDTLVEGIRQGTAELLDFIEGPAGWKNLAIIIAAVGRAAGPTMNIIANGFIIALQVAAPFAFKAIEILNTLSLLARTAADWSRSAEGMAVLAAGIQKLWQWSNQAYEAVTNLVGALGNMGIVFIQSGLADFMLDGFVEMTRAIQQATFSARDADSAFRTWLEAVRPILTAANEALGAIVGQLIRVADEVVRATNPSTGLPILVEILNGIRDAAEPLGNLLVGTFTDLGPVIAELIPKIAHFLELFLGSTPELVFFLETVDNLLGAFQALPDPVEKVIARFIAYGTILSLINPFSLDFIKNVSGIGYFATGTALNIGTLVTTMGGWSAALATVSGALRIAAAAAGDFMLAIAPILAIAAIGAILIYVAVNFDWDSAKQAYSDAREAGDSMGFALGEAFVAGAGETIESIPIIGPISSWVRENIYLPVMEILGELWDWIKETSASAWAAVVSAYDTYIQPFIDSVKQGWDDLVQWTNDQWQAIQDYIDEKVQYVYDLYNEYIAPYVEEIKAAWADLQAATSEMWTEFQNLVYVAVQYVYGLYDTYIQPYVDLVKAAWDDLLTWTQTQYDAISAYIDEKLAYVQSLYDTYVQPYVDLVKAAWDDLKSWTETQYEAIRAYIDEKIQAIYEFYNTYIAPFVDAIVEKWNQLKGDSDTIWGALQSAILGIIGTIATGVISTVTSMVTTVLGKFAEMARGAAAKMREMAASLVTSSIIPEMADAIVETLSSMTEDSLGAASEMRDNLVTMFEGLKDGTVELTDTTIQAIINMWNELPDETRWAAEETAYAIRDTLGVSLFEDLTMTTKEGMEDFQSTAQEGFDELEGMTQEEVDSLLQQVVDAFAAIKNGTTEQTAEGTQNIIDLWNKVPDKVRFANEELANDITDTLGISLFEDLSLITNQGMSDFQNNVTTGVQQTTNQVADQVSQIPQQIAPAFDQMGNQVVDAFQGMFEGVDPFVAMMIQAIMRMGAAMTSIGQATGATTGKFQLTGMPTITRRGRGGISDEQAELQPSVGGISSGVAPRVVYGEQQRRVKEAYIVEDRPDNLPYLAEAASWYGLQLVPGMATGGLSGQIGKLYTQVPHIPPPEPVDSAASQSTVSGTTGSSAGTSGTTTGTKKPSRRQRRRQRRRDRRQQSRTSAGSTGTTPTGTTPSGTTPTSGTGTTPTATGGTSGADPGAASPSQSAFPSNCGSLYPVGTPTESGQVPYRDAALSQSGMVPAVANPGAGADHVNAPANLTHPGDAANCGVGGSGSSNMPYPSTPLGGPGTTPSSFDTCLPAHVTGFQTGGTTTDPATGEAIPLDWFETPLGYWDSGLGYGWYADPSVDFPTIYPPAGWDPSAWYFTPSSSGTGGMARGGILKNGTRYFQGGGLNTYQLEAGDAAASGALGSFYSYGSAGIDGGYDCSGLWQYIYTAVVDGAPTPDNRWWGTYSWAGGFPGGEGVPGPIAGAMNVYTDLSGWEGDGTHTSGDIIGNPYEAIFSGVSGSSSAAGNDGIWSIGDPASIGQWGPVTPDYAVDPSAMMDQQVSSWWLCQAPTAPDIGAAPMYGPVEEWMATLPGMTQPFLQQAGQEAIGTLGSGTAGGGGTTTTDYIISALESLGMDTTSDAIASLEALIACESSGDPSATSPDGAMGLTQLMPDTWSQFGIGGDPYDPIANIAASINYQLSRYGGLVDFCPYEKGGFALGPQLQFKGEGGREVTVPLDDRSMAAVAQRSLGIEGMGEAFEEGFNHLSERIDNVAARVDHQTMVVPPRIAEAGDQRIKSNANTGRALSYRQEKDAMREIFRGGTH